MFVSHYALPHVGGVEVVVDALARELIARGHDVVHIASASSNDAEFDSPYPVVRVPAWSILERTIDLPYPLIGVGGTRKIARTLRGADVVHCHGMLYQISATAMQVARAQGCRCRILTEHSGPLRAHGLLDRLEQIGTAIVGRASVGSAHAVNLINPAIEPLMRRLAPRTKVVRIANGVDTRLFRPPAAEERQHLRKLRGWDATPRALFVGRAIERKGVSLAMAAAASGAFELVIVGPGNARGPHVEFLGEQPREDVAKLYRAVDVFLLPSLREGFPVTLQEAMASGLPAIVCESTTYERLRALGDTSVMIVPPDPQMIAAAVRQLISSPGEMQRRSSEAASFASREFSWSRAAQRHLELYEEVLRRGSPDGAPES